MGRGSSGAKSGNRPASKKSSSVTNSTGELNIPIGKNSTFYMVLTSYSGKPEIVQVKGETVEYGGRVFGIDKRDFGTSKIYNVTDAKSGSAVGHFSTRKEALASIPGAIKALQNSEKVKNNVRNSEETLLKLFRQHKKGRIKTLQEWEDSVNR